MLKQNAAVVESLATVGSLVAVIGMGLWTNRVAERQRRFAFRPIVECVDTHWQRSEGPRILLDANVEHDPRDASNVIVACTLHNFGAGSARIHSRKLYPERKRPPIMRRVTPLLIPPDQDVTFHFHMTLPEKKKPMLVRLDYWDIEQNDYYVWFYIDPRYQLVRVLPSDVPPWQLLWYRVGAFFHRNWVRPYQG